MASLCQHAPKGRASQASMLMRRAQEDGRPRFSVADLRAHLMPLLTNLFGALRKPESEENEYLMKAVTRVITFVGPEVWALCLQK